MLLDLRFALRALQRSPVFSATAVATLAIGLGGCGAIFRLVHASLLQPLPFHDPGRLVRIWESNLAEGDSRAAVSPGTFVEWRARSRTFEDIALFSSSADESADVGGMVIGSPIGSVTVQTATVSANLFALLGVRPLLGRGIEGDLAATELRTVVIGYDLWRTAFGADPAIVGKSITIEGRTVQTIAGVMPAHFTFPGRTQLWTPDDFRRILLTRRGFHSWGAVGRLRPGAALDAARADLESISRQLAEEYPSTNTNWSATLLPMHDATVENYRVALLTLFAAVGFVLLIGCANVSNLLLARGFERHREFAVQSALGATRARLARLLLAETAVLTVLGLTAGWVLARVALPVFVRLASDVAPRIESSSLNTAVFGFTAMVAAIVTVAVGVGPAVFAIRSDLRDAIAADGEHTGTTITKGSGQRWIIGAEMAVTLVLITGAVLLIQSFVRMRTIDLGFTPERVFALQARVPLFAVSETPSIQRWVYVRNVTTAALDRIRGIPGVQSAASTNDLPLGGALLTADVDLSPAESRASQRRSADDPGPSAVEGRPAVYRRVSPGFFRTLGITIKEGRDFIPSDAITDDQLTNPNAARRDGTIIVNETAARSWWPDGSALGRYVSVSYDRVTTPRRQVVGIVADTRGETIAAAPQAEIYVPYFEDPGFAMTFVVRTTLPEATIGPMLRRELRAVDSQFGTASIRSMRGVVDMAMGATRVSTFIVVAFAGIALVLAAIGVYGVLATAVGRRRREIGIRVALGASRGDILWLFLRHAAPPVAGGLLAGVAAAAALSRLIAGLLFGVTPTDPASFAAAAALLTLVAMVASYLPIRRALLVDGRT